MTRDEAEGRGAALWALAFALAVAVALALFLVPRWVKRVQEGGFQELVKSVSEKVWAGEAVRFTALFDRYRETISRQILSRDKPIAIVGEHADRPQIDRLLMDAGFTSRGEVKDAAVVLVLGVPAAVKASTEDWCVGRALVLYTGNERLEPAQMAALSARAICVPANLPMTALSQLALLATMTRPSVDAAPRPA